MSKKRINRNVFDRKLVKFVMILTACISVITGCDKLNTSPEKKQQIAEMQQTQNKAHTLRRAFYAESFVLDPHWVTHNSEGALVRDLFVGLTAFDTKGNIVPAVAQNWVTEDNRTWLFILDEKATWSNGESVSASDFVLSWQRLAQQKPHSPLSAYLIFTGIKQAQAVVLGEKPANALGVEAVNANTLKIVLEKPNSELPKMLAHVALLPTYQGEKPSALAQFPTNASYVVDEIQPYKIILATRQIETPFSTVEYRLLAPNQPFTNNDLVENVPASSPQANVALPRLCTYFYEFNFAHPQLSRKEVRQALKMKIHSARISTPYGIFNDAILPKQMNGENERQWQPTVFERLLTQAGVSVEKPLKLRLTYDEQGQHGAIASKMLRTLGESDLVYIQPQAVNFETLLAKHAEQDFDLIRAGWCADYPDPAVFLWKYHSASADNKTHYRNEKVDKALEQLQNRTLSEPARTALIRQITQWLEEDVVILPMFQYQTWLKVEPTLLGIEMTNPSEVIYSKDLSRQRLENDKDSNEPTN